MTLDDAKASLEALPGVYDVSVCLQVGHFAYDDLFDGANPDYVSFYIRIRSPELIPEETRQGILRVWQTLERELGCVVSIGVSAGLRNS